MKEQEHLEVSLKLALAIGYRREDMFQQKSTVTDNEFQMVRHDGVWCVFDYRAWEVIGPIAERLNCFPWKCGSQWTSHPTGGWGDTPQLAIALAVIAAKGVK